MRLEESDIQNVRFVREASLSENRRRSVVLTPKVTDELTSFMLDYGFVISDVSSFGDDPESGEPQLRVEFQRLTDL